MTDSTAASAVSRSFSGIGKAAAGAFKPAMHDNKENQHTQILQNSMMVHPTKTGSVGSVHHSGTGPNGVTSVTRRSQKDLLKNLSQIAASHNHGGSQVGGATLKSASNATTG